MGGSSEPNKPPSPWIRPWHKCVT